MPTRDNQILRALAIVAIPLATAGCGSTQSPAPPQLQPVTVRVEQSTKGYGLDANLDPCANRLEDLCALLHFYFRDNHHGPAHIDELKPYAARLPDMTFQYICPVSGKPYLCAPRGLEAAGENMRIYVYDAEPSHDGQRWCAMTKTGSVTGADAFFADHIPEARFSQFHPPADAPPLR